MSTMIPLLVVFALNAAPAAAADSTCDKVTAEWIRGLEAGGCPPLGRLATRMRTACQSVTMAGWSRDQKAARKRFLADCAPTTTGFPGVRAPMEEEGRTISHCGRLVHRVRGEPATAPIPEALTTGNGFDQVIGIVASAGFACTDPDAIDRCSLPTSVHTAMDQLLVQEATCKTLTEYPLDSTVWAIGLLSGAIPVDPFGRTDEVRAIIDDKIALQEKRQSEQAAFDKARTDELSRAKAFAADCLVPPADMHEPDQAGRARTACDNLLSLWRGDDDIRRDQEAAGTIPRQHATTLAGKVLNSESLEVTNQNRVRDRSAMLKEHQQLLIKKTFPEILAKDGAAAGQAYLIQFASLVDQEWVQDAQDRILELERKEAAIKNRKK
jgi:hypothetical protein